MTIPTLHNKEISERLEKDIEKYLGAGGKIKQLPPCTYSDKAKKESMTIIGMKWRPDKDE